MPALPQNTLNIIQSIQHVGIDPILYGSQGVSLYIGPFKQFGDIDLLVNANWINDDWRTLIHKMNKLGFTLVDEHEHEFIDQAGTTVAFADTDVLVRDKIADSIKDVVQAFSIKGAQIRTLKPEVFLKAYEFSARDGYRRDTRNKKDSEVITLIKDYLSKKCHCDY